MMLYVKILSLLFLIQFSNAKNYSLRDTEKLEFVSKSVSWIQGRDIIDSCFILNFGYEAPLPWPQVLSLKIYVHRSDVN